MPRLFVRSPRCSSLTIAVRDSSGLLELRWSWELKSLYILAVGVAQHVDGLR